LISTGIEGIILSNLLYRDFKFNTEFKSIDPLSG
jgi:hypothetical protein